MKKSVISVAAFIFLLSCKNNTTVPTPKDNYIPMNVGTHWVYRNYRIDDERIDAQKTEHDMGLDTVTVLKDSIHNGNTYKVIQHSNYILNQQSTQELLRDSANHLVNQRGQVLFSPNYIESDTIYSYNEYYESELVFSYKLYMLNNLIDVVVPAGTFKAVGVEQKITYGSPYPNPEKPKYCYAPNVGLVLREYKYLGSNNINFRSKLVSYKLK